MRDPKAQQAVNDQIVSAQQQQFDSGYGIVLKYDEYNNSATVLMARPGSDQVGEMYHDVPCPTHLGVQSVAPEHGRPCWVVFRDGNQANPMITHFYHHSYNEMEYDRQYYAKNDVPRFMTEL